MSINHIKVDVTTKLGYDIATALRGPDAHIDSETDDPDEETGMYYPKSFAVRFIKYVLTGRLRTFCGCTNGMDRCKSLRRSWPFVSERNLVYDITSLVNQFIRALRAFTEQERYSLLHYIAHIKTGLQAARFLYNEQGDLDLALEAGILENFAYFIKQYTNTSDYDMPDSDSFLSKAYLESIENQLYSIIQFEDNNPHLFTEVFTEVRNA